jgi:hypothetical protein
MLLLVDDIYRTGSEPMPEDVYADGCVARSTCTAH